VDTQLARAHTRRTQMHAPASRWKCLAECDPIAQRFRGGQRAVVHLALLLTAACRSRQRGRESCTSAGCDARGDVASRASGGAAAPRALGFEDLRRGRCRAPGRCDSERDRPARVVALWVPQRSGQGVPLRGARREHGGTALHRLRSVADGDAQRCVDFMLPLLQGLQLRWMRRR